LRRSLTFDAKWTHGQVELARLLVVLKRDAEAVEAFRAAIVLSPEDPTLRSGLGAALHRLGRYSESVEAWRETVKLRQDHALDWNGLGFALNAVEQYPEAADVL
ncbi:MAG: tetratricopeptide repeat protein, partial [Polyangiales bacterium]